MPNPMTWNWPFCRRREANADRAEELAASLAAGLDAEAAFASIGAAPAAAGASFAERFRATFTTLDPIAFACVEAAERSGTLVETLRSLAARERHTADLLRDVAGRIAYPVFVCGFGLFVVGWLSFLGQASVSPGFGWTWVGLVAALVGLTIWLWRKARRDPGFDPRRVPWFGDVATEAALLPYLDAFRQLYAAGVRIDDAHATASTACGVAQQRARLIAVTTSLRGGAAYGAALDAAGALEPELRRRLAASERIGELESGLVQTTDWLRARVDLGLRRAARVVGAITYTLAVVLVIAIVLGFYSGLYRGLLR